MKNVMKKGMVFCALMALAVLFFSYAAIAGSTWDGSGQSNNTTTVRRPHHPPGGPLMRVLDTDKDGRLSAAEIADAPGALLTLDSDGDGMLGHDELRPRRPGGFRGGSQGSRPSWPGQDENTSDAP